jgi:signal transduction histidine kinase
MNLLSNAVDAVKAVEDGPRHISIRTLRDPEGAVRLTVQDTGVGLSAESRNNLFDLFYTTKPEGMGIGLSVSRSIIESFHGQLWCEPSTGQGTTFAVSVAMSRMPFEDAETSVPGRLTPA